MRRSKYLSMTKSKPDPISRPKAWHLHPDSDQFVAKELEPVAMTQDDDDDDDVVTSCFPITQQQLKDLSKPGTSSVCFLDFPGTLLNETKWRFLNSISICV